MQKSLFDVLGKKTSTKKEKKPPAPTKSKPSVEKETKVAKAKTDNLEIPKNIKDMIDWKNDSPVPYKFLVTMLAKLEDEPGRNAKIDILTDHLLAIACSTPEDMVPFVFICLGELRPAYEGVKVSVGEKLIIKGIAQATGRSEKDIDEEKIVKGDLGSLAMESKKSQNSLDSIFGRKVDQLTIRSVYKQFLDIARMEGNNVQRHKIGIITKLLSQTKDQEAKFIVRFLLGDITVGTAASTILISIGRCFRWKETYMGLKESPDDDELKRYGKKLKEIYHRYPLIDKIINKLNEGGFKLAEKECDITPGIPANAMLAKSVKSTQQLKNHFGNEPITCEYKYDGERAQIHKTKEGKVMIFSRNSKNSTLQFEEVDPLVLSNVKADDFIIDSEIVAYDHQKGYILPFQTLMHRPKKGSDGEPSPIQICVFAFDVLYVNGESLIHKPLRERRKVLYEILVPVENKLQTATYLDTDLDNIKDFFNEAVEHRTEGLMIKSLDSCYEPGKRSDHWEKLKKDYVKGLGTENESSISDSVDVVIVGASYGEGKRTGFYGNYLCAIWNDEVGKFQTICKVGTGFSDQNLKDFYDMMQEHIVQRPPIEVQYGKSAKPDVYIKPFIVWEIAVADITISPTSMACFGDVKDKNKNDAGISLRFGRFLRIREDKEILQCTDSNRILDMYYSQTNIED